ncbi:hypothetical protein BDY19DRAFT_880905 [Irpex rosettiformis]|uniref:Uncharacterized protein n=1 Tax=Irpex rosettiformis TaxID=378272 RepID=A0ACB8UJ82_9APHY|nr:hypothetical protein BDY19DRAFT_880905 [Irpex rosettiformis]
MSLKALFYAYVLGGLTFIPLVVLAACFYAIYTSVPVGDPNVDKLTKAKLEQSSEEEEQGNEKVEAASSSAVEVNDLPKPRKGWLTVRRTFEELPSDGGYVGMVKGFLDARSKDPKRSRPKDMWYVALKGKVLYLYEDENMTECEAVIELGGHDVAIYPEGLPDGELYAKRNAICLKPKVSPLLKDMPSVTKEMITAPEHEEKTPEKGSSGKRRQREKAKAQESEKKQEDAKQEALDPSTPWFIFVKSNVEMEDWYLGLIHASDNLPNSPTLNPLQLVFRPADMQHLVETLDEQPDVIPMRWLNALLGRIFFSYYRTQKLESYIIRRLMHKLSKVKRPTFLTNLSVREVSVGNTAPTFSKPMLKELTKEGDASLEVHIHYKGEIRITIDATATINLGARFKSYEVKIVLAAVLREIEGNLLVKVKRPPSSRIWYAFTQVPKLVLDVEPVVSERQITWSMILSTIESRLREVILESIVLPNMDDISFFESFDYGHRGGIWADASRHERFSGLYPSSEPDETADDVQTISSAPALDTIASNGSSTELASLERSHSAPAESQVEDETAKDLLTHGGLPRAQTVSGTTTPSLTSPRRRTWFNSASQNDEASSAKSDADESVDSTPRGRPAESLKRMSSSDTTTSQPMEVNTPHLPSDEETGPISSKRSLSQHSQASSSPSQESTSPPTSEPSSGQQDSLFAGFRSKSPGAPLQQKDPSASPTNNFFQTLKSRDKQAISNTAKEAIRKWGVSWGNSKKGSTQTASSEDGASDGESQRDAESKVQKHRPSYAEVRAAVEQRRISATPDGFLRPDCLPSEPVAIQESSDKLRSISPSSSARSQHGSPPSISPQPDALTTDSMPQPRSISPGPSPLVPPQLPPRTRTVSHHSQTGAENVVAPDVDEDEHPAHVIQAQPSAPKAMIIPGIHAKHRGEVMSMGYAPPPPLSEPRKPNAIPNMYRLWKSPSNHESSTQSQPEMQNGFTGSDQDTPAPSSSTLAVVSSASMSTPGPALPPRSVPPPLPPRSVSINAVQNISEPPRHPPEVDKTSPPATATLQSIASRDESKRNSQEFLRISSSPGRVTAFQNNAAAPVTLEEQENGNGTADPPSGDTTPDTVTRPTPPALPPRRPQVAQ